jgi:hypothetical protein
LSHHHPDRSEHQRHDADRRSDHSVVAAAGARKHRFDGLSAGVPEEIFELGANLATGRIIAENQSCDRDGDDHQRAEREHRIIGEGSTEQRGLVA